MRMTDRVLLVVAPLVLSACARGIPASRRGVPTEFELSAKPSLVREWADRVTAEDLQVCAAATTELAGARQRSLPLLRSFLRSSDERLRVAAFDSAYRIGPEAIPLLTELLQDRRVTNRRTAADLLIDLAPDTEPFQPSLCRALRDDDAEVARDAARAIGALGDKAGSSVPALARALSHADAHVRLYAAEALASVGGGAAAAMGDLAQRLHDDVPGVRWAACEALGSIGPAAAPAVPQLTEALGDEWLFVRLCAAGALGSIGPQAAPALQALKRAATDPALAAEVSRATRRIAGDDAARASDDRTPVAPPDRTETSKGGQNPQVIAPPGNPAVDWDAGTGRNVLWSVGLGNETFGRPVVAGGVVYVGTDNA